MKLIVSIILAVLIVFMGIQILRFTQRGEEAAQSFERAQTALQNAKADFESLQKEYQYFLNPINLEKELRTRFNYKKPDEGLIIIVPSTSTQP